MLPEQTSCKLECQDLISQYFIALDSGARDKAAELFTDDGAMVSPRGNVSGQTAIRARLTSLPAEFVPVHLITNIVITPTATDSAQGMAYVVAYNMFGKVDDVLPRKMPAAPSRIGTVGFKFRKTAAGWRITEFRPNTPFIDDGQT